MKRIFLSAVQLLVFLALLTGAGFLWVEKETVSAKLQEWSGITEDAPAKRKKRGGKEVSVIVESVAEALNKPTVLAIGTARAVKAINIIPEVSGEITSVKAKAGEFVTKGQTLLTLDDRKARIAVSLAQAKLRQAQLLADRAKRLNEKRVNSEATVVDAKIALEQAKLDLFQAKENLADHFIIAPFSGHVGIRKFEAGDRVTNSMTLFSLDDRSSLFVAFDLPEEHLATVKIGTEVQGRTPGFKDRLFSGSVTEIDSRVDPVSRTVRVRASFDNKDDALRPGISFAVSIELPGKKYVSVNELAVQWESGGTYVWRIVDEKAKKLPVKIVRRAAGKVLLTGELKRGDMVVVEGVQRLRNGRKVRYHTPSAKKSAPTTPPPLPETVVTQ